MPAPSRTTRYILIGVAALLLLVVFDIAAIWHLSRRTTDPLTDTVISRYQTPVPNQPLGIEPYPNAALFNHAASPTAGTFLVTNDSRQQVVDYYRSRYPTLVVQETDEHTSTLLLYFYRHDRLMMTVTQFSTPSEKQTHIFYVRSNPS